jgi:serine/threonine protein kinase
MIIDLVIAVKAGLESNCELEKLRSLKHPRIVQYFCHGFHSNKLYFAIEYIEGINLSSFFEANHIPLSEELIKKILAQLVSALLYCHEKDLIHLEIKLDNILIIQTNDIK